MSTREKSTFDFKSFFEESRALVDQKLDELLAPSEPELLWKSMRYSVLSSGKRIRAVLCLAAASTVSRAQPISVEVLNKVLPCACSIEMIHAMSLIHDDLPCLDNDDLRRGQPTNHVVFGEAVALLAGDALLMQAVKTLLSSTDKSVDREVLIDVVEKLVDATGAGGMVGGQIFDLIYTGNADIKHIDKDGLSGSQSEEKSEEVIDLEVVEKIHRGKTAALITFSLWSGARLAGATPVQLRGMERFGGIMGLAFQIADDLLDVTGDSKTLGKTPGKDEAADKATWVRLFGVDGAREKLEALKTEGREVLKECDLMHSDFDALPGLLDFAIQRTH
ncbi:MAG: polyprenyl synthetase family protein [Candidatus Obscuribacterales bacterium]